jgi:soluble P-type ATPase
MIAIDVPGLRALRLAHLVCDFNGTLALDGKLLAGVAQALAGLAGDLRVHVVTADTFGRARSELAGLPVAVVVIAAEAQAEAKRGFVEGLGADGVVAIGNGRNDRLMLAAAGLGIAVIQAEGACAGALAGADVVSASILDALELLRNPRRLVATLRS